MILNVELKMIYLKETIMIVITVADVIKSVANLTQGKTNGEEGFMSDNIIHGTHSLYVLLTIVLILWLFMV